MTLPSYFKDETESDPNSLKVIVNNYADDKTLYYNARRIVRSQAAATKLELIEQQT